ncbi:MAG: hypothetical protein EOO47_22635 [Flavobacterium sp.]|nr:MAG: hypothetical protein EOO47_22635 [Flavobacterium sp.]
MKFAHSLLLFFAFAIVACNSKSEKAAQNIQKIKLEAFTDTAQLDTFKVALLGEEPDEMKILFTITTQNGGEIYKKEIAAKELLKSYLAPADLKNEDKKLKFLTNEVNFFFDEEHILIPAVTEQEKPDHNAPDKAFYEELKASKLNGFSYRIANDINIYIGWSAKDKKVKIYYKCC